VGIAGIEPWGMEQTVICHDESVGLRAVIAIDDTRLGPGLGGIRLARYPDATAAIREAQRLAAAMTRKNAVAELPFGGAKAVVLDPGPGVDRAALMRRFGDFVARTGGAYLPGVDMGTTPHDLALVGESGAPVSCSHVDPSGWTARGVRRAIDAAVAHRGPGAGVAGLRVLVQGAGHVGRALALDLAHDGAELLIADADADRAAAVAAEVRGGVVAADAVIGTRCDVFAPCAVAGVLTPATIAALDCAIVAGAANDTLASPGCAELLAARGILYVPDFVANAGGVIQIHAERVGWDDHHLADAVDAIGPRVAGLLAEAAEHDTTPLAAAEARAARRLAAAPRVREAVA
jgi:leucine dehydrogenase